MSLYLIFLCLVFSIIPSSLVYSGEYRYSGFSWACEFYLAENISKKNGYNLFRGNHTETFLAGFFAMGLGCFAYTAYQSYKQKQNLVVEAEAIISRLNLMCVDPYDSQQAMRNVSKILEDKAACKNTIIVQKYVCPVLDCQQYELYSEEGWSNFLNSLSQENIKYKMRCNHNDCYHLTLILDMIKKSGLKVACYESLCSVLKSKLDA